MGVLSSTKTLDMVAVVWEDRCETGREEVEQEENGNEGGRGR